MRIADLARLLLLAALWGGSFAFMRVAVPALGPVWLAESRVAIAFALLLALALARRDVPAFKSRWRGFLVVGAVNSALPFALFCFAEQFLPASTAAILNATSPFFGAAAAAVWLRESLKPSTLGGMALGLAGVILLVGWHAEPQDTMTWIAILACLAASLCYGIASVYAKARMTGTPSFAIALYSQMTAAIVLAPVLPFVPSPGAITPLVAGNVLGLAVASTAVAYLVYFRLIADIGPSRALSVTFLIPLFGVLWGFVFLGEPVTATMLAGGILIFLGTWLAARSGAGASLTSANARAEARR